MDFLSYIRQCEREDRAQMDELSASRTAGKRPAPNTDPHPHSEPNANGCGPPVPFNVSRGLITGCHICPQQTNLSRCSACKVVFYCSSDHQATDRPSHKVFCKRIQKISFVMWKDEAAQRAHVGDIDTPPNALRKYMQSGKELVHEVLRVNTKAAVEVVLEFTLRLLQLSPKDPMGMRCIAPFLFLHLGRDQECYDFCKWWVTIGNDNDYQWKDVRLSQEMMKDEDVFEPVDVFQRIRDFRNGINNTDWPSIHDLSHLVAVTLVKIRMLWGTRVLRMCKVETFQDYCCSTMVLKHRDIQGMEEFPPLVEQLEDQIALLYCAVERVNKHFWPALLNPGNNLVANSCSVGVGEGMGEETEMQKTLQECYHAWMETEWAFVALRELAEISNDVDRKLGAMSASELDAARASVV